MFMQTNGPTYQVPTGRRDGLVSNISLADDMPDVSDSIQLLTAKFLNKGLTEKDLVLLSGTLSLFLSLSSTNTHTNKQAHAYLSCRVGEISWLLKR